MFDSLTNLLILSSPSFAFLLIISIVTVHKSSLLNIKLINLLSILIISLLNISTHCLDAYILLLYSLSMLLYSIYKSIKASQSKSNRIRTFNEETYIFDREFKNFGFSLAEYRKFIKKKAVLKRTNEEAYTYSKEGADANKVILFISIPSDAEVLLSMKGNPIVKISESSWVGSVELVKRYHGEVSNCYNCTMKLNNRMKREVVWIEWSTDELIALITKHKNSNLVTKLLLIWANYLCKTIVMLKDYALQAKEELSIK